MGAVRRRKAENGRNPIRAAAYVRISAEEPLNSADRQKAAIRRYAEMQNLHIAFTCSKHRRGKHS